jgi:CO/xanthine dehydrogenase Mo-binding subunit
MRKGSIASSIRRVDGSEKSEGRSRYLADIEVPGVLTARFVTAERAPARLLSCRCSDIPDGYICITAADIPGINGVHMIDESWPLFADDEIAFVGQPVAMVLGPDPVVVADLLDRVHVEYREAASAEIVTLESARASASPELYAEYALSLERDPEEWPEAVRRRVGETIRVDEAFETGAQEHVYLETQSMMARVDGDTVVVEGSMQCPFYVRTALASVTALPADRVRVVQTTTGGGFGGKEEFPSVIACAVAVGALVAGAPVRMILDRDEDIRISTKRHPSRIAFDSTIDSDGRWASSSIDVALDAGAYVGLSNVVLQRALFGATGAYRPSAASVEARTYRTTVVPYGAFRGFGAPQAVFAVEMHMTHLAARLGEDPLAFRRRHVLRRGDRTLTGGVLRDAIKLDEMINLAISISDYDRRRTEYDARRATGSAPRRGIGVSVFSHGCGFTGSGEQDVIKARVALRRSADQTVEIRIANVEMGQGALTTLRKIVARTLGIPIERVGFHVPDTADVPDSGPTVASRTAMVVGGLLQRAALRLAEIDPPRSGGAPQEVIEHYVQPNEIRWNQDTFEGDAYPAFSWGVNIIEVEVDPLTCQVTPTGVWAVYDIGEPLDERIVVGQMHGGIVQALGWATSEVLDVRDGRFLQHNLTDYIVPGSRDIPPIDVRFVSNPYEHGPFGAKGAGELPFNGPAAAIAGAVEQALDISVYRIPLAPEYLMGMTRRENDR